MLAPPAPPLTSNVTFEATVIAPDVVTGGTRGPDTGVVVNVYAFWSNSDNAANLDQYFDSIIDPAGFFDHTGTQVVFPLFSPDGFAQLYPTSTYDSPAPDAFTPHVNFYQNT